MALTLFGHKLSLCTRRVLIILHEKGVKYEFETIDILTGEQKKPEYIAKHPFGVVPLIEDGKFSLYESRAIGRYLAIKYEDQGTPLIPSSKSAEEWGLFEQWGSVEYSQIYGAAEAVLKLKLFNPARGIASPQSAIDSSVKALHDKLDVLDTILAKQEYLAGDKFSLVDAFFLPTAAYLLNAGESAAFEQRSNLQAWWERVSSRESWKKTVAF